MSDYGVQRFGTDALIYTIPFLVYGLLRYLYKINDKGGCGDSTKNIFSDHQMFLCFNLASYLYVDNL